MVRLRAKIWVLLFFGLIGLGQAYPYSYAWAQGRHAECGCNDAGRKCIHGCDLKKKSKPTTHHVSANSPIPIMRSEDGDSRPFWVSPDCSKQKKREILDFRGDPFVPQTAFFFLPIHMLEFNAGVERRPLQRSFLPDPPPPKA